MKTRMPAKFQLATLFLILAGAMTPRAQAQGVVDQTLQRPAIILGGTYHYDAQMMSLVPATGQEFTPSLQGLDFVDVNLSNPTATNTGTFAIAIHAGNIAAPVLGLSAQVARSEGYPQSNTHFTFPSTVPVTPGDLYVLEIIQLGGNSGWATEIPTSAVVGGQTIDMNYPGGRLIYGGMPQATQDMIFREGIIVPEPGIASLCALPVLAFGYSKRHRQNGAV